MALLLLESLRQFVTQHVDGQLPDTSGTPLEPVRFLWLVQCVTWWTVMLEGTVAAAFLWPLGRGVSRWRDGFLLLFCATAYAVVPVEGFGWLLIAMGVAQYKPQQRPILFSYVVVFGLILLYREISGAERLVALVHN